MCSCKHASQPIRARCSLWWLEVYGETQLQSPPRITHVYTIHCPTCELIRVSHTICIAATTQAFQMLYGKVQTQGCHYDFKLLGEYNKKVREFRHLRIFLFFWKLPGFLFMVVAKKKKIIRFILRGWHQSLWKEYQAPWNPANSIFNCPGLRNELPLSIRESSTLSIFR